MKKSLFAATGFTLLVVMTGCRRQNTIVTAPPPPPPPPPTVIHHLAIPHATLADMPDIQMPAPPNVVLGGAVEPIPSDHKEVHPSAPPPAPVPDAKENAQRAATAGAEPPKTTPIGQLSAAPNTQGLPSSKSIGSEIQWIDQQLKNIHHALNTKQQRTETQIQTFLAKATNALQAGDLDGAHTLTVKARVLLGELQ